MAISTGFESYLGPPEHRYFGAGYRKTRYSIQELQPGAADTVLEGIAAARYAPDWSMRAGIARVPHLSTLDAIVFAAWTAQGYLSALGLSEDAIARAWISEIFVKAGRRPIEDLDRIALRMSVAEAGHATQRAWARTILRTNLESLTVTTVLEHEAGPSRRRSSDPWSVSTVPMPEVFGVLFRSTDHRVHVTQVDQRRALCRVELAPRNAAATGLASAYWPSATFIDNVVVAGQLIQIALACNSKRGREASTDMWIRTIRVKAPDPLHSVTGNAALEMGRLRAIRHGNTIYTTCDPEVSFAGVRVAPSVVETSTAPA